MSWMGLLRSRPSQPKQHILQGVFFMRNYECKCLECGKITQVHFKSEPYPEYGEEFRLFCKSCNRETTSTRTLTRKTEKELRKRQAESDLRQSIVDRCDHYGFQYRFLYQSVIVTTPLSDWCFDYHHDKITLYHESTTKINFATGDYAKAHMQFQNRSISPVAVIDYIASHDEWRAKQIGTSPNKE